MTYKAKVGNGYYMRIVEVEVDARLTLMPYAQCGVRFDNLGGIQFISYNTEVINIDPMGWLTCSGVYSMSTRKQIGKFLAEYAPRITFKDVKKCYEDNKAINIYTGEIADLP